MRAIEQILIDFILNFVTIEDLNRFLGEPRHVAILIGGLVALSCSWLGTFLILRKMAMISDAISHTVLLGIVVAFLVMVYGFNAEPNLSSPLLLLGATGAGVLTVILTEIIHRSNLVREDAALGLVFPFLFALSIILISRYTENIHLDQDAVILGEIGVAWADTNSYCYTNCTEVVVTPDDYRATTGRVCINCGANGIHPRHPDAQFQTFCYNCGTYTSAKAKSDRLIVNDLVTLPNRITSADRISLRDLGRVYLITPTENLDAPTLTITDNRIQNAILIDQSIPIDPRLPQESDTVITGFNTLGRKVTIRETGTEYPINIDDLVLADGQITLHYLLPVGVQSTSLPFAQYTFVTLKERRFLENKAIPADKQITLNDRLTLDQFNIINEHPKLVYFPKSLSIMGLITLINMLFVLFLYKELKLTTFDSALAATFGFRPALLTYILMSLVSLTAVGAFDAVGAVLVVGFFVIPPATAYLLTDRLWHMLVLSPVIAILAVISGYNFARGDFLGIFNMNDVLHWLDQNQIINLNGFTHWNTSISAAMVVMLLFYFIVALIFSPRYGVLAAFIRRIRQRRRFALQLLLGHVAHHQDTPEAELELAIPTLHHHLKWTSQKTKAILNRAQLARLVSIQADTLHLTDRGLHSLQQFRHTNRLSP